MKGGIKKGDWKGLRRYIKAALRRCGCELDKDRRDEIELFLIEKFWCKGKNIPTRKDVALKWALRTKLRDACFQNHTISTVKDDSGEDREVDIFEVIGKNESRYKEIEQWHDIESAIGAEPARALLFSLYEAEGGDKKEGTTENKQQGVLF